MLRFLGKTIKRLLMILLIFPLFMGCTSDKSDSQQIEKSGSEGGRSSEGQQTQFSASQVKVLDGDTVRIGGETIRLLGIDTPEKANKSRFKGAQEPWATKAEKHLRKLIEKAGKVEIVRAKRTDQYGRTLAYIKAGKKNLNAEMIRAGMAWETVNHYGPQGFKAEAEEIRSAWKDSGEPKFLKPHTWRKRNTRR